MLFLLFLRFSYQDSHSQGWCTNTSCWSWVGFRLDTVCVMFVISVAAGAFYVKLDAGKFELKWLRKVLLRIIYISANSHALCVSLTPTDLKLGSHAFRPISHA